MNILYLTYNYWPPAFGGELLSAIERFKSLVGRGHKVTVLTSGDPDYRRHEIINGIEVFRSPVCSPFKKSGSINQLLYYVWCLWNLTRFQYDVVHIGYFIAVNRSAGSLVINSVAKIFNWLVVELLHARAIPTYYVYSLADRPYEPVVFEGKSAWLKRRFLRLIDCVIAVSPAICGALKQELPSANVVLLPYGVQDDLFVPLAKEERDSIRNQLCFQSTDVIFSFLGSVVYRKGFDLLARAFAELSINHHDWKLLVIGPRSKDESKDLIEGDIEQVATPLDKNTQVLFLGRIDDRRKIANYIAASDVFVFPSRNEGMGIAPMEAMSTGIPTIVSLLPGITDQANVEGETGTYISSDNLDALKAAMITLGANHDLRKCMGQRARDIIVNRFGWLQYIDEWEQLYLRRQAIR